MKPYARILCPAVLAALLAPVAVLAQTTLPVSDPEPPRVYDQPSAARNGGIIHVAFIGGDSPAGPFRVYYAAVRAGSDFTNLELLRGDILATPPLEIADTAGSPDNVYADARHPKILMRSSKEAVVVFQAKPAASPDPEYALYRARLVLDNNAVVAQYVQRIAEIPGFAEDPSFRLVTSDNTIRLAYDGRPGTTGPFRVYYARVGIDNNLLLSGSPAPLSDDTTTQSDGLRPLPSLALDSRNTAHVGWAANGSGTAVNGVFYAMVKVTGGVDNVLISATELMGRTMKWGYPAVMVVSTRDVVIAAVDETEAGSAGAVGYVQIDPEKDDRDGDAVEVRRNREFLLRGPHILPPDFNLLAPEAFMDSGHRIHMTGYGTPNTSSTYYAFKLTNVFPYAEFVLQPVPVGFNEFPGQIAGDYSKAAFAFIDARTMVFWSGTIPGSSARNLDVTTVQSVGAFVQAGQSGCQVAGSDGGWDGRRIPGALLLLLPAAVLAARRLRVAAASRRAGVSQAAR